MERSPTTPSSGSHGRTSEGVHAAVVGALEGLGTPAALLDPRGSPLHVGERLSALLKGDPEAGRVLAAAATLVHRLDRSARADGSGGIPRATAGVRTAAARYALRAVPHPGNDHAPSAFLVAVAREDGLPSGPTLSARYGLTAREGEVALLLARGASDREAAEELGISPHTVRKHAEHIFSKLGIHTRKALALRLLGGP